MIRTQMTRIRAVAAALSLPMALPAAELAYEPFDYSAANPLAGEAGGNGWFGAWTQDGETGAVRSDGLNYTDGIGNVLDTTGLSLDTSGSATTRNFRDLDTLHADVWISFLYHLPASNSKFEGISFYRGATSLFGISSSSVDTGSNITLNIGGGGSNTGKGLFGVTHFVVLKVSSGTATGGNDQVQAFIDPFLTGVPSSPDAEGTSANFDFNRVRIAGQDGSPLYIDEIRIGATFADVSPHSPAGDGDSDGDGLSDAQEAVLGLDPGVSDASLIAAIQAHPEFFDLYDTAGILALGNGGVVRQKSGDAPVDFTFEVQHSGNLIAWPTLETFNRSILLPEDKNFLRVTLSGR